MNFTEKFQGRINRVEKKGLKETYNITILDKIVKV